MNDKTYEHIQSAISLRNFSDEATYQKIIESHIGFSEKNGGYLPDGQMAKISVSAKALTALLWRV